MTTLKKRRAKWYARVLWYDDTGKRKEKQIPLRTKSILQARERLIEVKKKHDDVIEHYYRGEKYSFSWMNDEGISKIEFFSFKDAVKEWLSVRRSYGIADSTISRNKCSMNSVMNVLGRKIKLSEITMKSAEDYVIVMERKGYSPHGININLRALKTFLNWAVHRDYLEKMPYFKMAMIDKALPSYIADGDFAEIMKLDWLDQHYKLAFQFYRVTGCRLREPFVGVLTGTVLIIPAKYSKSRMEKEIELDVQYLPILVEMQERYQAWRNKVKKPVLKYFTDKYSKEFKRCCRAVGIDRRFHDLRHTFAVRRYMMTRDIYQVMKEMGHSKVTTTQVYSEFNMTRLKFDFPALAKSYQKTTKFAQMDTLGVDTDIVYSS